MLARVDIEHELRERTMQSREVTAQKRKTCAGQLCSSRKIEKPERFPEVDMILDRKVEASRLAGAAHFGVVQTVRPDRRRWMREIRELQQKVAQCLLHACQLGLQSLELATESADFR